MTTIFTVDATSQAAAQQREHARQPAEDFAHELARHDEQAKQGKQSAAKTNPSAQLDEQLPAKTARPMPVAVVDESAGLAEVQPPLDAALAIRASVTPTGVTEALLSARVFGWHAMAQAYLSELSAADKVAQPHDESHAGSMLSATSSESPLAPQAATAAQDLPAEAAVSTPSQIGQVLQTQSRLISGNPSSENIAELAAADTSAPAYWSERSLRFTRQRDGGHVAWLRDFRLSDAEASHLIQFVLQDAKAKGVALSKIMLNGREAWSSPNGK
jgi:hypothetical protein